MPKLDWFATDEPAHLRRLTSKAMNELFDEAGADPLAMRYRSHLFTTLVEHRIVKRFLPLPVRAKIALLDWHLFRHLPNGATMVGLYQRR